MTFSNGIIRVPMGKYLISAMAATNETVSNTTYFQLASYITPIDSNVTGYTRIVNGVPAQGGTIHLQHYYTPTQDTDVSLRVFASTSAGSNLFPLPLISNGLSTVNLSIVKIW
jgi:hypothetical protein